MAEGRPLSPAPGSRLPGPPLLLGLAALVLLGAACGPATPVPPPESLLAPKQLATVVLSPTPVSTPVVPPTPTRAASPTATPAPPTATPSPTPYVGVFMGDGSAPIVLPTAPVMAVVEATLRPPTAVPGVEPGVFPTATLFLAAGGGVPVAGASGGGCPLEVAPAFLAAYTGQAEVAPALGCPTGPPETYQMAQQSFEHGMMFWRVTREIWALTTQVVDGVSNRYWRVPDQWEEGQPPDDPSLAVPPGVRQPIRGFGLAWRVHGGIRNALGWAVSEESGYTGTWQSFERGAMFSAESGAVYALLPADGSGSTGRYLGPLY